MTMRGLIRIGWTSSCCRTRDDHAVAVGGAPTAGVRARRPDWFPSEFDWVFGCAYAGLPEKQAPLARLIGANMSVRRLALAEIGGFHSDNHDDMDMCHRLMHLRPADQILYEPMARVHHFVPAERTTWGYFWRRCFFVNKGKVEAFRHMEGAANLSADISFVGRALSRGVSAGLRQALGGDVWGAARALSIALASFWQESVTWRGRRSGCSVGAASGRRSRVEPTVPSRDGVHRSGGWAMLEECRLTALHEGQDGTVSSCWEASVGCTTGQAGRTDDRTDSVRRRVSRAARGVRP